MPYCPNTIRPRGVQTFVAGHTRTGGSSLSQRLEWIYLLDEMTLSVYATEILGFETEIWEPD